MFLASINLLPTNKKERLSQLVKFIFFKELLEIILLTASFLSIVLLWSWVVMQNQFNDLSQSATLVNKEFSHYNQQIKKINNLIKKFDLSSNNFYPLTPKIVELSQGMPVDIKINSLSIDNETGEIIMVGTAKTRDALLGFQSNLKKYDWLSDIQTPTSQLFQKENVNFEIRAKTNIPVIKTNEPVKHPIINTPE